MQTLKKLDVANNQLSDIETLYSLTGLEALNISENQIRQLSPKISDLTALTSLNLTSVYSSSYYPVIDLELLSTLKNLKHLEINKGAVSNLTALERINVA